MEKTVCLHVTEVAQNLDLTVLEPGNGSVVFSTAEIGRPGLQFTGFYEHFLPQRVQMGAAVFFRGGEEALKGKSTGGQPRNTQSGDGGAGTGNGADGDPGFRAESDQVLSGVGDGGRACVRDQRAGFSAEDALDDFRTADGLVVLIIADQWLFQLQKIQQPKGHTGVLCGNKIHRGQHLPATFGDVGKIADRGWDEIKHTAHRPPPLR